MLLAAVALSTRVEEEKKEQSDELFHVEIDYMILGYESEMVMLMTWIYFKESIIMVLEGTVGSGERKTDGAEWDVGVRNCWIENHH